MSFQRTRFAPSPTGLLHIGNAYSALHCSAWAKQHQAECILRIEDIDHTRCKDEYTQMIVDDLAWLGLTWPSEIRYQSKNLAAYQQALTQLQNKQVLYPCFCTRKDIHNEIMRISSAPHAEDKIAAYPGICRNIPTAIRQQRMLDEPYAWRLDINKAFALLDQPLFWQEQSGEQFSVHIDHDVIIGRKDIHFSYHLAVVVDDAAQHISHIIRGDDLRDSTGIHRLLQALLNFPEPTYNHHALLCDVSGQRLAKRNGAISLQSLRKIGVQAERLCDFLASLDPPTWPFMPTQQHKILRLLGKQP